MAAAPLDDAALQAILAGTAGETGEAFFAELVRHLAQALGTTCAWVTEWLPEARRLRALAFWVGGEFKDDYEYAVANTPCGTVMDNRRLVHIPERLIELYSDDPDLRPLGAVSYLGVPLVDTDERILGHLAVMHDAPMPADPRALAVFGIFAGRAAAELRRVRRDRELREREQRLSRLIDSARDAIIEVDTALAVVGMNPAAEQVFRCRAAALLGAPIDGLLAPPSRPTLQRLARELARQPSDQQSLWIPDALTAQRADGEPFPAEATLSRFELDGRAYFTVILRDVNERVAAEARIRALASETATLREEIAALLGDDELIGDSPALRAALADLRRVAGGDTTVLITGETGTGKELVARAIHRLSPRAAQPLVKVNCAAIASTLQESELFGHEKGAFTGATQRREGRFALADGGTIFLDEVGEMPLDLQAKLLRVLQEGELDPVGSSRTVRVDVRVIAATNRSLDDMVRAGTFRQDLLYRLNVFPLHVPPLRQRGDDVVRLAEAFAAELARRRGGAPLLLRAADRDRLRRYEWPGNVRELRNVIERAVITSEDGRHLNLARALPEAAPVAPSAAAEDRILTADELRALERENISRALAAAGGKIAGAGGAAERLGLNPNTLSSRMKSLGIARRD
ncbi:sigma 54-interacting transcriptional regulator [bacterium]|nr:sigma 54-interacting transcriptional regulator [bacterium]